MKIKHILLVLLTIGMASNADAQFFNKLKKKAEDAAARALLNKAGDAIEKEIGKAVDNIILGSENSEGMIPPPPDNNIQLPDGYNFSFEATIQVKNNNGKYKRSYFLQPDSNYYAIMRDKGDFDEYVVYDNNKNMEVYFAEIDGTKRSARKKMDIMTKARQVGAFKDSPNTQITTIGSKKIRKFDCSGYKITSDSGTTEIWITNQAPATPFGAFFKERALLPDSPFTSNSMIMLMKYTSTEDSKKNYEMECKSYSSSDRQFILNDYIQ